jgi:hypothetical protein
MRLWRRVELTLAHTIEFMIHPRHGNFDAVCADTPRGALPNRVGHDHVWLDTRSDVPQA